MKLDLYWSDTLFESAMRSAGVNSKVRNYISKLNINKFIDKTYDDTLKEEAVAAAEAAASLGADAINSAQFIGLSDEAAEIARKSAEIDPKTVDFWGSGFAPDVYVDLERRYEEWTKESDGLDLAQKTLYKNICLLEVTIARDAAAGKAVDKNISMLNNLLGSLNLKPNQKRSDADGVYDNTPFGEWVRRWENLRPIPEPDPELKDVDGIIHYISVWFLGHLCKMLKINNTYSAAYEREIERLRVERPEYADEDDESFFDNIFGGVSDN